MLAVALSSDVWKDISNLRTATLTEINPRFDIRDH